MTTIAYAPRTAFDNNRKGELLGATHSGATAAREEPMHAGYIDQTPAIAAVPKAVPSEIEKVVRKMPTLYVIAFFGVVVFCAVVIIWNTLQVNKLTAERTKLDDQITQTEQRLIRLRAEEMQLSAPDHIRPLAQSKLGMIQSNGEDIVIVK
jgi:cell division protein FtsL